jgi:3-phenylpropionate/trans-cinnamate dioxygenase ferredoxin reductase subunit
MVIGGGFIGLETAPGKDVTVVDVGDRLLARAVAPVVSDFYLRAHERRGTRVLLGTEVDAIEGDAGVSGVRLAGGCCRPT